MLYECSPVTNQFVDLGSLHNTLLISYKEVKSHLPKTKQFFMTRERVMQLIIFSNQITHIHVILWLQHDVSCTNFVVHAIQISLIYYCCGNYKGTH